MTVDVATLVFEFKSDSAGQAEKAMDRLIEKGDRLDATAKKVRRATDMVNEGHRGAAAQAERSAQGAMALANAEGAVERAVKATARASAEVRAQRQLEAAAMRELVQATKAYERDQARAAAQAAQASRELDRQIADAMRGHQALNNVVARGTGTMKAATQAGLNLSRQFADIGVTAAMGMNPLMILIQQGPQVTDALTTAKMQGVGLNQALVSLAVTLGLLRTVVPVAIKDAAALAVADQAAAAAALEAAAAERAKMAGTAQAAAADEAAAVAAANLAAANEAVATTATAAAAAQKTALAPLAIALGAVAVAAGVAFGAAGLAARKLNQDNKDLVKSLHLTEKQLEHLKDKGVETSVTIGDVFKGLGNVIGGALGKALAPIGKWFSDLFDLITRGAILTVKAIVGGFLGAFEAVKATWKMLPAAIGDLAISAANATLSAIEGMINKAVAGINLLIAKANAAAKAVKLPVQLGPLGGVSGLQVANPFAGSAAAAGTAAATAFQRGNAAGQKIVDDALDAVTAAILKAARDRITKAAGKAGKDPKAAAAPRDMSDERVAQLAQQIAQAKQEELQATLAVTREVKPRAALEREILAFEVAEKQAQIDGQIARLADELAQKKISANEARVLAQGYEELKARAAITGLIQQRAINEREIADLAQERLTSEQAARQNHIDLLIAQADLLQSSYARALAEQDILKAQQELEKVTLQAVTVANGATAAQEADAKRRLETLGQIHAAQAEQAKRETRLVNAIGEASSAVRGFKDAFKRHDWARAFDELQRTIETVKASFAKGDFGGGVATAAAAIGSAIGGKTGRTLEQSAGIYAMAAPLIGGPLAAAAAALYAAAKLLNVGGKPTNAGAGYDLTTRAISGNKRTEETEGAARAAGDAIQGIQDALKVAGVGLNDTIRGLVIGTRDQTQIYTAAGKTLLSAVGDSGAAVDTAMRAVLEGATYVSDAQKKLVESALATGKGFDAVAEALAGYEAAQKISGNLADEILRIKNPQAFDTQAVKRDIEEQRTAYKALATEGFLTAEQLATINTQLTELEGLRLADVLKRYADAVDVATEATNDNSRATELSRTKLGMEAEIARLQGKGDIATGIEHALILDQQDESLHATQMLLWAEQKLAAERDHAAEIAQEAADRAKALAEEHAGLELQLARTRGDDGLVTRLEREAELVKATDDTSRSLINARHAQEDLNTANERARTIAAAHASLLERLHGARGETDIVRSLQRAREMAEAVDDHARTMLAAIYKAEDAAIVLTAANDNLATARSTAIDAYQRERSELEATESSLRSAAEGLRAFRRDLDTGAIAGRDPVAQLAATRREFNRLNALGAADPERLANLQSVSQAFLEASKAASPTQRAFERDLAAVRRATDASAVAAEQEADVAKAQLAAQLAMVSELGLVNSNLVTLAAALAAFKAATSAVAAAKTPANDNFNTAAYLAANPDIGAYALANGLDPMIFGPQHWLGTGQYEVASGQRVRGFAGGGMHPGGLRLVGEEGPELEVTGPSRIYSARETAQMVGGDNSEVVSELRQLRAATAKMADKIAALEARDARREFQGIYVRGETPGDAVQTEAAA